MQASIANPEERIMRDGQAEFEDFIHHHINSERLARCVVRMLAERWGWQVLIEDIAGYESQALAD